MKKIDKVGWFKEEIDQTVTVGETNNYYTVLEQLAEWIKKVKKFS